MVVVPSADGPLSKMCSSTSARCFAASTIKSRSSRIYACPVNSANIGGRSEISKAASGSGGFTSVGVMESWSNGTATFNNPSLQVLGEHELGAAGFYNVIDMIERVLDQMHAQSTRLDLVM